MRSIIITLLLISTGLTQWPSTSDLNLQVSRQPNVTVYSPFAITDGDNGTIVSWKDNRKGYGITNIFVQRIDRNGALMWDSLAVEVTIDSLNTNEYSIIEDGEGGAFIVWAKISDNLFDIYAQRINNAGQRVWSDTGIVISNSGWNQKDPVLVSDSDGGFFVAWEDYRYGSGYATIFGQHVDKDGNFLWKANGKALHSSRFHEDQPEIIADGLGGAIVVWSSWSLYEKPPEFLFAQRVNSKGNLLWGSEGKRISETPATSTRLVTDGNAGAIVGWTYHAGSKVWAQKIDSSGNRVWSDTSDIIISSIDDLQHKLKMLTDGKGGAYFTWADSRGPGNAYIYMQHVNGDSSSSWTRNGILISDEQSYLPTPLLSAAPDSTVYIAWEDVRNNSNYLWTQRVNPDSTFRWQLGGVATAIEVYNYSDHHIFTTEDGDMIAVWTNQSQVFSKKIHPDGSLGIPTSITEGKPYLAGNFYLFQNYPNPFNPKTIINYELPITNYVDLSIYNLLGQKVATLVNKKQSAGNYKIEWDASGFASGVYLYRLETNSGYMQSKKLLLVK